MSNPTDTNQASEYRTSHNIAKIRIEDLIRQALKEIHDYDEGSWQEAFASLVNIASEIAAGKR